MSAIHKALIEAIVYLAVAESSDVQEDDDVRTLEWLFAELGHATPNELEGLFAAVRIELEETQNPVRINTLESIIVALSE